ncbi:unnamed protein product [Urochloa decumbens]|uniref:Cytochrome P450 n=1 Tax=Urochloa decumbens TaxID=240449 RepID=A0ABC8Y8X5_9POAL
MDAAALTTSTQDYLLFLFPAATTFLSPLLAVLLAASLIWLFPGGPAWAAHAIISRRRAGTNTPTPPPGAPGVLTALAGPAAHRALASLSRSLPGGGAALSAFSVGLTRLVVASKPDTARELLSGAAFADRPIKDAARELLFHRAMGFAPSGGYWRALRRLSSAHLFSPRSLAASAPRRAAIGERMLRGIGGGGEVAMRRVLHEASLDHVMAIVFGVRYNPESPEGVELEEMVKEGYDLLGVFNWGDHLPLLGWLDLQGVRRRCRSLVGRVNVFVGRIIEEHRQKKKISGGNNGEPAAGDFVNVLLGLESEEKLSDSDMIAVLWEMIFRGTDTVAILLEWVMARMALHRDIQSKAQAELDAVVGATAAAVSDADVARLPYLQHIVKETLRVHPPGPLLSWARLATRDAVVGGHLVPAGTTAMVNMWAIARDPEVWAEPEAFRPERFEEEGEDVSVMGGDLRLAPFGAGRRVCPGKAMALATVHLWLAQLLHRFEWAPAVEGGGVDLSERLGMSLEMEKPLVCKATPRW